MRRLRLVLVACLLVLLAGCGVGEFLVKRTVLGLQDEIASEFKSYADFSDQQQQQIDRFAEKAANWVRFERLPILAGELEKIARDVEGDAQISLANWQTAVIFMEDPLAITASHELVREFSSFVHGMNDAQIAQTTKKLQKKFKKYNKKKSKLTTEKENDKIVRGIRLMFREIGIARSKQQLREARSILDQRISYIDFDRANTAETQQRIVELLSERNEPLPQYQGAFQAAWQASAQSPYQDLPDAWAHNLQISHALMNQLLLDLTLEERMLAARNIRDYASLFRELSVLNEL